MLEAQKSDEKIYAIVCHNREGKEIEFLVNEDGFLYYRDQVCVPNDNEVKKSCKTRENFNFLKKGKMVISAKKIGISRSSRKRE